MKKGKEKYITKNVLMMLEKLDKLKQEEEDKNEKNKKNCDGGN
jgi:GTP-binding protein EngB required for normal cell division